MLTAIFVMSCFNTGWLLGTFLANGITALSTAMRR